jgi:hypothetical protein
MAPASLLVDKDKEAIFDKPPISEGMEPVKQLLERARYDNARQSPRAEGMAPASLLLSKYRAVIFDKPPISEGMEPVKQLL